MEKFAIGLLVGGAIGAVLTANNYKMRTLVRKAQQDMQNKLDTMMDERICAMENGAATPQSYPDEENDDKRDKKRRK
ncbi:MAG: hypothetical protein IKA40_04295 [Clostridia bacterium]|nr:hypothetical protein [Clostridia bacterium]